MVAVIETFAVLGVIVLMGILGMIQWLRHLEEEHREVDKAIKSSMIDDMWTCSECGAFNSPYNKRCGKCFVPKVESNEK